MTEETLWNLFISTGDEWNYCVSPRWYIFFFLVCLFKTNKLVFFFFFQSFQSDNLHPIREKTDTNICEENRRHRQSVRKPCLRSTMYCLMNVSECVCGKSCFSCSRCCCDSSTESLRGWRRWRGLVFSADIRLRTTQRKENYSMFSTFWSRFWVT